MQQPLPRSLCLMLKLVAFVHVLVHFATSSLWCRKQWILFNCSFKCILQHASWSSINVVGIWWEIKCNGCLYERRFLYNLIGHNWSLNGALFFFAETAASEINLKKKDWKFKKKTIISVDLWCYKFWFVILKWKKKKNDLQLHKKMEFMTYCTNILLFYLHNYYNKCGSWNRKKNRWKFSVNHHDN